MSVADIVAREHAAEATGEFPITAICDDLGALLDNHAERLDPPPVTRT